MDRDQLATFQDFVAENLSPVEAAPHQPSLALCVVEVIQAPGGLPSVTASVLERYAAFRAAQAGNAEKDGAKELLASFDTLGVEEWMERIGTRNRMPPRPGAPYKAETIQNAAKALLEHRVDSTKDLVRLKDKAALRFAWTGLPGQTFGISWHHLLVLAGCPGIKPDAMQQRAIADVLGVAPLRVTDQLIVELMQATAKSLAVDETDLDWALWRWQRSARKKARERP